MSLEERKDRHARPEVRLDRHGQPPPQGSQGGILAHLTIRTSARSQMMACWRLWSGRAREKHMLPNLTTNRSKVMNAVRPHLQIIHQQGSPLLRAFLRKETING